MKKTDHIVYDCQIAAFKCLHCGETLAPKMPLPVTEVARKSKGFTLLHQDCKPKKADDTRPD